MFSSSLNGVLEFLTFFSARPTVETEINQRKGNKTFDCGQTEAPVDSRNFCQCLRVKLKASCYRTGLSVKLNTA